MNKRLKITAIAAAVIVVCGISGYLLRKPIALWMFDMFYSESVAKQLEDTYHPLEGREEAEPPEAEKPKVAEPFSILLLGIDQRNKEIGRSDTIIYAVVRPEDHRILLISIPRDAYVDIIGRDKKDKITHAYAFGGAKMSIDTVEHLLKAPVDHYASINFKGFVDLIDHLGGLKLELEEDLINRDPNHERLEVRAGKEIYSGEEVLGFVRYREDAGGDISRTQRHQQLLYALMDKAKETDLLMNIPKIMEVLGDHFQTSMRPEYIVELAKTVVSWDVKQVSGYTLRGSGTRIGGVWYYALDEQDLAEVQELVKRWLDPATRAPGLQLPQAEDSP